MLTNLDVIELTEFRRELHRFPEISGEEANTAGMIETAAKSLGANQILTGLGGHGVAVIFDSGNDGPTVLFRAELDALPIEELSYAPWVSKVQGKAHLCGHDGHMAMLLAFGRLLSRNPVATGRVVLMFQPAEEDGSGARAVVNDPAFKEIAPDWAFAIHNEPGRALGIVSTRIGVINYASQGLVINLKGKTAHAASPEDGISPVQTVASLLPALSSLANGGELNDEFTLATLTHVNIGEPTFGIAPSDAAIYVTLRTANDDAMSDLVGSARQLASEAAEEAGLEVSFEICDEFAASINDADAVKIAKVAMDALDITSSDTELPMRESEDFGVFGWGAKAAMLRLGSGEEIPALHNPDYDFPDELIPIGSAIFDRIARDLLGSAK